MERRELFKIVAAGALAESAPAAARAPFFTPAQTAALDVLSDIVIPSDEQSPGAHEAGVVRYLDLLAGHSTPERRRHWQGGLAAVDSAARARFSRPFVKCSRQEQEALVAVMAAHEGKPQNELERFFELLKPAVVDGYRYSEIGVTRYMRWEGNHEETAAWAGACKHPAHGAKPGEGKRIVFVVGDQEYRSEESMPALARILAERHGFECVVLFERDRRTGRIDPGAIDNIPGLEQLRSADLMVLFTRWIELPDEQMKEIVDYTNSGRPIVGLRTASHPFNYRRHKDSPYARYSHDNKEFPGGYGRQVMGETWIRHYGKHQVESTRGVIAPGMEDHPILRGVKDIWGASDVYAITTLSGDSRPLVLGQVLAGMEPTSPPNPEKALTPVAWIKSYTGDSGKAERVFMTTMGHALDFTNEGFRRMMVNACYWATGLENEIEPGSSVEFTAPYRPNEIGVGKQKKDAIP